MQTDHTQTHTIEVVNATAPTAVADTAVLNPPPPVQMHSDIAVPPVEFCHIDDVRRIYGLTRGKVVELIKNGKIQSVSLQEPGKKFGVRLVFLPSLRAYLLARMNGSMP